MLLHVFGGFKPSVVVSTPPSTNLWGWWGADDAYTETSGTPTTLISADGTAIGSLKDKSGNGRHLYQTVAGSKPTFKSGILNSLPAILSASGKSIVATNGAIPAGDVTIYVVMQITSYASTQACVATDSASPSFMLYQNGTGSQVQAYRNNGLGAVLSPTNNTSNLLAYAIPTSGSSVARLNGGGNVTGTTGTGSGGSNISLLNYNGGPSFVGYIMEVLLYDTNHATAGLGTGDGLLARQYLDQKYGLGLGL